MTQVKESHNNVIPTELLKSDSLISSSINEYITKLNTLEYLQKNNPNYPIPLPTNDHSYSNHNGELDIDLGDPNQSNGDYSKYTIYI